MIGARLQYLLLAVIAVIASFGISGEALAQSDASGDFTGLLDLIQTNAQNWHVRLQGYATSVFWSLALIQLVWTFFPLVFKQADLGEIVGELIRFVMIIGFFYALLTFSMVWSGNIVDSFRQAGSNAAGLGSSGLSPGDIFDVAVDMAVTVANVETWNPLTAMMVSLAGIVILLCFAFIAAFMGLTIIESYIVINASVLFMGFGASSWTRDYAVAMLRYAVAVGAKLFVLTLLVGLIISSAKDWQAAYNATDNASMWTMVGLALVCAYFAKTLPELVASLITGVSPGGGSTIGMMAGAAAAGAAAAAGVVATAATAGAAAPVAAGGTAAAGGAGAAAGGGGLASSLGASIAGGSGAAGASTGGVAGSGLGSGLGSAATTAAKTGGNSVGAVTGGGEKAGGSLGKLAGKAADGASGAKQGDGGEQAAPARDAGGNPLHTAASAATRAAGILSAISVPGMESSAGLSLGSPPPNANAGPDASDSTGTLDADGGNTITGGEATAAAPADPSSSPAPLDGIVSATGDVAPPEGAGAAIAEMQSTLPQGFPDSPARQVQGHLTAAVKAANAGDGHAMDQHLGSAYKLASSSAASSVPADAEAARKATASIGMTANTQGRKISLDAAVPPVGKPP